LGLEKTVHTEKQNQTLKVLFLSGRTEQWKKQQTVMQETQQNEGTKIKIYKINKMTNIN
jgi:hypothetical protein